MLKNLKFNRVKRCPACNHLIDIQLDECPYCSGVSLHQIAPVEKTPRTPMSPGTKKALIIGICSFVGVLLLALVGTLIYDFIESKFDSDDTVQTEMEAEIEESPVEEIPKPAAPTTFTVIDCNSLEDAIQNIEPQLMGTMSSELFGQYAQEGEVYSNIIKYEHTDGIRYQFFFSDSPNNSSSVLTGIAISEFSYSPDEECYSLDNMLENGNYEYVTTNLFKNDKDVYFSPGFTSDRAWCYIYQPEAPDKSPAPRRY